MSSLGDLFYNLHIQDFTEAEIKAVNDRLAKLGSDIKLDPSAFKNIRSDIEGALKEKVKISFDPQIKSADIEAKLENQVVRTHIKPLTAGLARDITDALRSEQVWVENLSINPAKLSEAIRASLSGQGFSAMGDAVADAMVKAIHSRFGSEVFKATVQIRPDKLSESIIKDISKAEQRDFRLKYDAKSFRKDLEDAVRSGIKVPLDPQIKPSDIEAKIAGKAIKAEIVPLAANLRKAIKDACNADGKPFEVSIGPKASLLQRLVTQVLGHYGFTVNISTVTGLETAVKRVLQGNHIVTIQADPQAIAKGVQTALANIQSKTFGLEVAKDVLYRSIDTALAGRKFSIQIEVMHDQARRAVQNALNNARMVGKDDALAYQRLQTGELRAAQAELARLKAAHQGAASSAKAHASASLNLGSAMGSNIKIAGELGSTLASLYSIHALKNFLSQVVEIGGELEHQKIALETIYGSGSKMENLYAKVKGLARESPFGVMELTKNIKQLSAYGVAYNEVYDTAKRLADISAATSVDIQRLILAFGKTKNRTFLDGLEAKQFAYANIPIYDALSRKLTELEGKFVSVKEVMGRIKKREIGFDMVKDILWEMTDEGGKFYNMQEKLAGSVKTSWKLVRDNIELMFGEIAESQVGDWLKDIAQLLQGATKDWKSLASVVIAAGAAFSLYRLAVLAHNVVAGKSVAVAAKQHAGLKMARHHANLAALSYRSLTQAEEDNYIVSSALAKVKGINVLWSKKLTAAEAEALLAKKLLTKEDLLRLVALRKLSRSEAELTLVTAGMTAAEKAEVQAQIAQAAAAKKSTVIWGQLKAAAASAVGVMRTYVFNPAMLGLAALSTGIMLWSKHSQAMEKAEETGSSLLSKAVDSSKELQSILDSIEKPQGLSDLEISQDIEKMETAIKDLSPDPLKAINETLVDQDGHVLTLIERHEALRMKILELQAAYDEIKNKQRVGISAIIPDALKDTKESWFNDNLETNAKDYSNALKKREKAMTVLATRYQRALITALATAQKYDEGFKDATKGMESYEERLRLLVEQTEKYPKAAESFQIALQQSTTGLYKDGVESIANRDQIRAAYDELISDTEKFVDTTNSRLRGIGVNPEALNDTQKMSLKISLRQVLDSMESAGDDAKAIIVKKWEEAWGIVLMEDKIGPSMKEKFKRMMADSTDEGIKAVERKMSYEGFDKLSDSEKDLVKKMMEQAKSQTMKDLGILDAEMAKYLADHPLERQIQLVYTDPQTAPSLLAKELVTKKGYPGLTATTDHYVREWTRSGKVYDSRNAAKEARQEAKNELDAAKAAGVGIAEAQKKWDEVEAALKYLGWSDLETKDQKSNKHGSSGSKKDAVAEALKQRFKDLKDAWSEYQKWQKTLGDMSAAEKVASSGLFGDMKAEDVPRTADQFREAVARLRSELENAGIKGHTQRESLANELIKNQLDIDKSIVDEKIKAALEAVEKAFEKETADFNLYEKLRKATGNESLAYTLSFGLEDAETDYEQMVRNHYKRLSDAVAKAAPQAVTYSFDLINEQNVSDLPDELQKAWREAVKAIAKYREEERTAVADILAGNLTAQQEIIKLRAEAAEKIRKIEKEVAAGHLSRLSADNLIGKINSTLDYEVFRRSAEYMSFFNASLSLSSAEADKLGAKIKANLDERLSRGAISASEYADEMEKINGILNDIHRKTSGFGSFLKGGLSQYFDDTYRKAEADYQAAVNRYDEAAQRYRIALENGDQAGMESAQAAMDAADSMKQGAEAAMTGSQKARMTMEIIDKIVHGINDTVQGIRDAFSLISDMADSFGIDTSADTTWGAAGAFLDAFSQASDGATKAWDSLKSGNVGGVISGVAQSVTSWFTVFNRWHDSKLQKDIERSQQQFQQWQYIIDAVERRMEHFLGNVRNVRVIDAEADIKALSEVERKIQAIKSQGRIGMMQLALLSKLGIEQQRLAARKTAYEQGGALGYERQLMQEQLTELERQRSDMEKMKKKDPEAIAEITDQIDAQRQAIRDFAEEMASSTYGIELSDWASQIGDALVDAFARGENAAEAFDKTVSSILRSLVSKMISQDIIAPMFNDLRDYLFGTDGMSGAYGTDFELQPSELSAMKVYLDNIRDKGIPAAEELFKAINEATGGILNDVESADTTVRGGIQALTENTGDLLASYVNAIRDYCARNNIDFDRLVEECMPRLTLIAEGQLAQLTMISEHTRRNMIAAEAIQQSTEAMHSILQKATRSKDSGFYIH